MSSNRMVFKKMFLMESSPTFSLVISKLKILTHKVHTFIVMIKKNREGSAREKLTDQQKNDFFFITS